MQIVAQLIATEERISEADCLSGSGRYGTWILQTRPLEPEGRKFESSRAHHSYPIFRFSTFCKKTRKMGHPASGPLLAAAWVVDLRDDEAHGLGINDLVVGIGQLY